MLPLTTTVCGTATYISRESDGASNTSAFWQYVTLDNPAIKTETCSVCKDVILKGDMIVANIITSNHLKHFMMHHAKELSPNFMRQ